jgi:hypothetical protein
MAFGLGFEMAEGPYKYTLTEIEEAILVAAGVGFSGSALWDQSPATPLPGLRGPDLPEYLARALYRFVFHQRSRRLRHRPDRTPGNETESCRCSFRA